MDADRHPKRSIADLVESGPTAPREEPVRIGRRRQVAAAGSCLPGTRAPLRHESQALPCWSAYAKRLFGFVLTIVNRIGLFTDIPDGGEFVYFARYSATGRTC